MKILLGDQGIRRLGAWGYMRKGRLYRRKMWNGLNGGEFAEAGLYARVGFWIEWDNASLTRRLLLLLPNIDQCLQVLAVFWAIASDDFTRLGE